MGLLGGESRLEDSFSIRQPREWRLKESEIKSVLRGLLARGYITRRATAVNRCKKGRVILAKEIVFRFNNLDVDREVQRISREYCERYRVIRKHFFVSFRSSEQNFFKAGQLFAGSYRE